MDDDDRQRQPVSIDGFRSRTPCYGYPGSIDDSVLLDMLVLICSTQDDETCCMLDRLIEMYMSTLKTDGRESNNAILKNIDLLKKMRTCPRGPEGDASRKIAIADYILNNGELREEDPNLFEALTIVANTTEEMKADEALLESKRKNVKFNIAYSAFRYDSAIISSRLSQFRAATDLDSKERYLIDIVAYARKIADLPQEDRLLFATNAEERAVFSSDESLANMLEKGIELESPKGILKTDLQGLNKMLGVRGGFARGEFVIIYGLSHHFKSGLLFTIARGIISCNRGEDFAKPGKKPLLLLISHENRASLNTLWFYRNAYMCMFKKKAENKTPVPDILKTMQEFYRQNGWEFIIEMYKGGDYSFDDHQRTIERYESQGYEVVVVFHDYMEKMKKQCSIYDGKLDSFEALKTTAQAMFDYHKSKNITYISPHQFNRTMQQVADRVKTNVVKHFSADGVSGSIAVNQIADLELYVYKEIDLEKQAWLTIQRGKHRYVDDTPEVNKYCAYRFSVHGILPDIQKKRGSYTRDIYAAGPASEKEAVIEAYAAYDEEDIAVTPKEDES